MDHRYFPIIIYAKNHIAYSKAIINGQHRKTRKSSYQFMLEQAKKTYDSYFTIMTNY